MQHLRLPGSQHVCTDALKKRVTPSPEAQLWYTSNLHSNSVAGRSHCHNPARPTTNSQSAYTRVYAAVVHGQAVAAVGAATQHSDSHMFDCDNAAGNNSTCNPDPLHSDSHGGDTCGSNAAAGWIWPNSRDISVKSGTTGTSDAANGTGNAGGWAVEHRCGDAGQAVGHTALSRARAMPGPAHTDAPDLSEVLDLADPEGPSRLPRG
ncbi:hypothetical protein AK812_SmicGene30567 [Symbiodinium microadriaticum]|uniref:Uncharacterized protein n=1 Tax=Symbiodinium microadriaticum TaxID=2951 RepID=A0A1Q9CZ10_SYMMI|nr:hypothetical protein AK812_SmicGene30567 [Symbiodinium microadriaticum]